MRRQHGLPALTWNAKLAEIGRGHSVDMARHGFFSHVDTRGLDPTARATKSGFACKKQVGSSTYTGIGENLYMTGLYSRWHTTVTGTGTSSRVYDWKTLDELALETVQAWMNSPGHRANLLDPKYDSEGIGIGISTDYNVYVTQDFC
ncbi:MAG TPA: CAP domain-containing protein [Rhodothermales bacterium]|nr:CAP domain-containing protein [Rhodothermales bacterium]